MDTNPLGSDFVPVQLRKENLTELIADALRDAIESGKLLPGQELNQVELATQFGVSRIPIREALIRLEVEGLVEAEPNRKTVVAQLSLEGLHELLEIRQLLEVFAVEKVCRTTPSDDARAQIETILSNAEQRGVSLEVWRGLNTAFHTELCALAARPKLSAMLDAIQRNAGRYLRILGVSANRIDEANAEHRAIWQACLTQDARLAKKRLHQHISGTIQALTAARAKATEFPGP